MESSSNHEDRLPSPPQRGRGRPRADDVPSIPWNEIEHALVLGRYTHDTDTGRTSLEYPTYHELAQQYGISVSLVGQYAKDHQCIERRAQATVEEQAAYDRVFPVKRAKARAAADVALIELIDGFIRDFHQALKEERVRTDSIADFNTMIRLQEFLAGRSDTRLEIQTAITLEELQERHTALRAQLAELDPVIAGEEDLAELNELMMPSSRA